jgi:hypothetical protein
MSSYFFYFTLVVFLLFMIRPKSLGSLLKATLSFAARRIPARKEKFTRREVSVMNFLGEYQNHLKYYWKEEKPTLAWNYLLTIVICFNKCLIAYVVLA